MREKSIVRNLSWTLIGELTNKATLFFATMYYAKIFSAENFGIFSLYQAIAMYSVMIIEISPTMYGIREIAKRNTKEEVSQKAEDIYGLRFYTGLIVGLLYILSILILQSNKSNMLIGLSFSLYIFAYGSFSDWLHKGLENFKGVAIASLSQAAIFIPLVIGFVSSDKQTELAALIWSGSFLVFSFVLFILQKKTLGQFITPSIRIDQWWNIIRESYHFPLNGLLGMAYQYIPLFLLSYFSSMKEVGSFSLMNKLAFAVCGIAYYLPSVLYPKLSKSFKEKNGKFRKIQAKLLILMIIASISFLAASYIGKDYFLSYFQGNKYPEIDKIYSIFCLLVVTYLIRYSFNIPLLAMGLQYIISKQMSYASILTLFCGVPLVYYESVVGAGYAVLIGGVFIMLYSVYAYHVNSRLDNYESIDS